MKKLIALMLIITVALVNTQAADLSPVSENIKKSFVKEFRSVSDVAWTWVSEKQIYKAEFMFDGKELNAYFSQDGEFLGTSRYISKQQMPVIVSNELQKKYKGYVVRTIIENASKDQTNYFITIEGTEKALMVKASPSGELSQFKKMRKPF